jgi:hypothetical protein
VALVPLGLGTLVLGMAIYHWVEGLAWPDAFLNAAMLLGGIGPIDPLHTTAGKWLAGSYALLAGVVILVLAGAMLAPVVHHVLQRFHLEADEGKPHRTRLNKSRCPTPSGVASPLPGRAQQTTLAVATTTGCPRAFCAPA